MLLQSTDKLFHAALRAQLLPHAMKVKQETQFGGHPGQRPTYASMLLRAFSKTVAAHRQSLATIFIDVRHAFHCLLRDHAFGCGIPEARVLFDVLASEGFDVDSLAHWASVHSDSFQQTTPQCLARLVRDAHTHTWFTLQQGAALERPCFMTTRGSRPVSPLADLAYNRLMSLLVTELSHLVMQDHLILEATSAYGLPVPVITWVDDICLPLPCVRACDLATLTGRIMTQVGSLFQRYGLRVNYSPGKTGHFASAWHRCSPASKKPPVQ